MDKKLETPLSNYDILDAIMDEMKMRGNIFDMRDIDKANNIEDIFKGKGHAVLFEENPDPNEDVGHWTVLVRNHANGGTAIYFDSYGDALKDKRLRSILGRKYKVLQFNPHQFQDYGKSSVCGRYALLPIALNKLVPNLNIHHIVNFLNSKPKNQTFDQFITKLSRDI